MAEPTVTRPLPSAVREPSVGPRRSGQSADSGDALAALNPLDHPICLSPPRRLSVIAAWHEHLPFAMFVIDLARPAVLVELGTHFGDSYCAFCQAVSELHLPTRCYAVDTWTGDAHSGLYGPEVLESLRAHHDPLYGSFSRLIQSTFDQALAHFPDGTVDLLHIDGYHTYEAVRHDFESWLPKLSPRGIVLMHDVNVREHDFGAWKLWEELRDQHPSFTFAHGNGLGVLGVGPDVPAAVRPLFEASREEASRVSSLFFELGHRVTTAGDRGRLSAQCRELSTQLADLEGTLQVLEELTLERERLAGRLAQLESDLQRQRSALDAERAERERAAARVASIERDLADLRGTLESERDRLRRRDSELQGIRSSLAFRVTTSYWRVKDRLLPRGTRARRALDGLLARIK